MNPPILYFAMTYTYPGGTATTVSTGTTPERALAAFRKWNPDLTVIAMESEHGQNFTHLVQPSSNPQPITL
jgi:hypothetical protein